MQEDLTTFEEKGFPSIKLFEKHFEKKAIDFWDYRSYKYSDIKEITHFNPNENWWNQLFFLTSPMTQLLSKDDPWHLKIIKTNGGDWVYKTSNKSNPNFRRILILLKTRIANCKKIIN